MDPKAKANFQKRLLNELKSLRSQGYTIIVNEEVNLAQWQAKIFFEESLDLGKDLKAISRQDPRIDALLVEIDFPAAWPVTGNPPSFRIVHPRLEYLTGGVSVGGTIQLESYGPTANNSNSPQWTVQCKVKGCLDQLKKQLLEKGARVDFKCTQRFYTKEEAKASLNRNLLLNSTELASNPKFKETLKAHSGAYFEKEGPLGNKTFLPPAVLQSLTNLLIDPPYTFEIVTKAGIRSNCGVLEFSAPPGVILLSTSMMQNLLCEEGEDIKIRCVQLPRGTFVLLQPHSVKLLEMANNDKSKMIALLEWTLPSYATLTMGDTIEVTHGGVIQLLNVIKTEPSQSICIFADPYLDINIDFTPALDYVDPNDKRNYDPLAIVKKPRKPGDDESSEEEESDEGPGRAIEEPMVNLSQSQGKRCGNCHRFISNANFQLHEAICSRQNALCPRCNGVFKKTDMDHHLKTAHIIVKCACGFDSDKTLLSHHQETSCPLRLVTCIFCGLQLVSKELDEHMIACGSKTIECPHCKKFIITKSYESHLTTCQKNPANEKKRLFPCIFCEGGNTDMEEEDLIFHLRNFHAGISNVTCPICIVKSDGQIMKFEQNLIAHLQFHESQIEQKRRYENRNKR